MILRYLDREVAQKVETQIRQIVGEQYDLDQGPVVQN